MTVAALEGFGIAFQQGSRGKSLPKLLPRIQVPHSAHRNLSASGAPIKGVQRVVCYCGYSSVFNAICVTGLGFIYAEGYLEVLGTWKKDPVEILNLDPSDRICAINIITKGSKVEDVLLETCHTSSKPLLVEAELDVLRLNVDDSKVGR